MVQNRPCSVVSLVLCSLAFVVTVALGVASRSQLVPNLLFNNSQQNISSKYFSQLSPENWTYYICCFIGLQLAAMFVYQFSILCRPFLGGGTLYAAGGMLPSGPSLLLALSLALDSGWLFVWDRELLVPSVVVLVISCVSATVAFAWSLASLHRHAGQLIKSGHERDLRLVVALVHNALGTYAAWLSVATVVNAVVVLIFGIPQSLLENVASTIGFTLIVAFTVVYLVFDQIIFEAQLRYVFTPYVVYAWTMVGSIDKGDTWRPASNPLSILKVGLLGLILFLTVVKIIASVYRTIRYPLFRTEFLLT